MWKTLAMFLAVSPALFPPGAIAAGAGPASGRHQFGAYLITVSPDDSAILSKHEYQVTVERDGVLLARLTAPYRGTLSNSFVSNLDHTGAFDVVVTYTDADGRNTHVALYSWRDHYLATIHVNALDPEQRRGYRGGDEFAVRNGNLIRIFQVYVKKGDKWEASSAVKTLRYAFDSGRWVAE